MFNLKQHLNKRSSANVMYVPNEGGRKIEVLINPSGSELPMGEIRGFVRGTSQIFIWAACDMTHGTFTKSTHIRGIPFFVGSIVNKQIQDLYISDFAQSIKEIQGSPNIAEMLLKNTPLMQISSTRLKEYLKDIVDKVDIIEYDDHLLNYHDQDIRGRWEEQHADR